LHGRLGRLGWDGVMVYRTGRAPGRYGKVSRWDVLIGWSLGFGILEFVTFMYILGRVVLGGHSDYCRC